MGRHSNILPSFNDTFGGVVGFSYQDDTIASLLNYQGRLVQSLNSPCYAFLSQSSADQNNVHPVNPLNEISVASLTQASFDSFDESDLTVISGSIRDKCVTCNPDKESLDEQCPIPGSSLCSQSYLSENESDLSEQTPSNRLNLNDHLTNLPAKLAYPRDSRPAAVVDPLNLQQANSDNPVNSTIIVADKPSQAERRRERKKQHERERYRNDPAFAKRHNAYHRKRSENDPFYANGRRIYYKTYSKMIKKVSKEEASRLASVARAEYLRSVNSSEGPRDLPQTSNPGKGHGAESVNA